MKTYSIFILFLLFLTGCQREKDKLSFDEVAFVEYRVGLIPSISGKPDVKGHQNQPARAMKTCHLF